MRFTPWAHRLALTLSLSAAAALTACGGGGSSDSKTQVRLLNATRSYAQLDLTVNDKTINSKVAYAAVGEYGTVDTGSTASRVLESSVGTSISATTPTLNAGSNYTYITYGFAGTVRTTLLEETQTAPEANKAKLLILNLAPDAGSLDVYVTSASSCALTNETALVSNLGGGNGSGYNQINSGTFRVCVTGYNKPTDLRLAIPAITLDSASVNTLILTASDGGVLVNGITMVQKGAAKNYPTTLTRVRAVNALAGAPIVSATIAGNNLLPASVPPNTTDYASFTAGANSTAVLINGVQAGPTSTTFAAGGDYTMLIWGTAADPKIVVLSDDNRLPTVSGNVKIRLVNAIAAQTSGVSLNVDFSAIASNVLPGVASTPNSIPSTTATTNSPVPGMSALPKRERP